MTPVSLVGVVVLLTSAAYTFVNSRLTGIPRYAVLAVQVGLAVLVAWNGVTSFKKQRDLQRRIAALRSEAPR